MLFIDQEFLPQAISVIERATSSIDIATFKAEITSKPRGRKLRQFFEILFEKHQQGIKVRFLLNWHNEKRITPATNLFVIRELKQRKIDIRILPYNRCCHAKIILVDHRIAIIGSHNLSVRSCHNNFETSYLIQGPVDLARLGAVFSHTFNLAKAP